MGDANNIMVCELMTIRKYATYGFLGQLVTTNMPLDYCSFVNSVYFVASAYMFIVVFMVDMEALLARRTSPKAEGIRMGTDAALSFLGWLLSQALFRILGVPYFDETVTFSTQQVIRRCGYIPGFFFILCTAFIVTFTIAAVVRFMHNAGVNLYRFINWVLINFSA